MRILYFTARGRHPSIPENRSWLQFAARWTRAGHEVTVMHPADPPSGLPRRLIEVRRESGVRVLSYWSPGGGSEAGPLAAASSVLALLAALSRGRAPDVVLAPADSPATACAALVVAALRRAPLVLAADPSPRPAQSSPPLVPLGWRLPRMHLPTALARRLLRRAARIVVPDHVAARRVVAIAGGAASCAAPTIVPEPLDDWMLELSDRSATPARPTLTVGCPAAGSEEGSLDLVLDVALLARESVAAEFELLVAAEGGGEIERRLERRAARHGLDSLRFEEIASSRALYDRLRARAAAALVVAPADEPLSAATLSALSAMAAGVPVVVAGRGRAARLVEGADCGAVIRDADPGRVGRALGRLLSATAEERERLGARGRRHLLDRRQGGDIAARLLEVLVAATGRSTGPAAVSSPRIVPRETSREESG